MSRIVNMAISLLILLAAFAAYFLYFCVVEHIKENKKAQEDEAERSRLIQERISLLLKSNSEIEELISKNLEDSRFYEDKAWECQVAGSPEVFYHDLSQHLLYEADGLRSLLISD